MIFIFRNTMPQFKTVLYISSKKAIPPNTLPVFCIAILRVIWSLITWYSTTHNKFIVLRFELKCPNLNIILFVNKCSLWNVKLTPLSRHRPQTLRFPQLVQKFPAFMEHEGSLPHSQESATCPYPEPDWSSPCFRLISQRYILILSSHLRLVVQRGLLPSDFPTKTLHESLLFPIRATCTANLSLLGLITRILFGEEYRA